MKSFVGFPAGKVRFTPIPDLFFTDLLPKIDDLAELRLTLFMFWFLHRQKGYPRYLTLEELKAEGLLLSALCTEENEKAKDPKEVLEKALERAVRRGTLLQLDISDTEGTAHYFFVNTAQGRKAVEEVRRGELLLEKRGYVEEPHIERPRPNIFELYEQNIGLLTPLLAEKLEEAERDYPQSWIEEAFQIAVERNVRNWRYIEAILERWNREGKT
ncbi:MAG: DnaD domain protein [Chloroflexota bacterium]|nr:DnaD domain protein [Chloroflexota bacterium]